MLTKEQRAHDIAVSILPDVLKSNEIDFYEESSDGTMKFNNIGIAEEYWAIYEALLEQLPDQSELSS